MSMTSELKQQFTLKISQANKTRLVVILYEMMLVYIEEARQANEAGDQESFRKGIITSSVISCCRKSDAALCLF